MRPSFVQINPAPADTGAGSVCRQPSEVIFKSVFLATCAAEKHLNPPRGAAKPGVLDTFSRNPVISIL